MKEKYIIALGASAGGISALSEFFDNTLPDAVSYVITTHLYPHQKSMLTEIIQKHSALEVCEVENDMEIKPNTVYVMPENKTMSILNGQLVLIKRDLSIRVNMAIDMFFNSLSKDTIFKTIAIILSGMGEDGTKGAKAIAKSGGYIIAQIPISADSDSMPESVIASGYANEILYPRQMPQAIIDYLNKRLLSKR
ncbi:chemotaxis protein CheB [Pedobacter antarcticus]|uniref:chemotaxis protein CheB n=1 Tax=Pedobacter antarcticus TaxID=34086 RepID=UPI000884A4EA|nr:chemotaxis protein CheB [Pedobacter antarcticus]SDM84181.1 CheB methylesterase [Pedobacter antarcticus]